MPYWTLALTTATLEISWMESGSPTVKSSPKKLPTVFAHNTPVETAKDTDNSINIIQTL